MVYALATPGGLPAVKQKLAHGSWSPQAHRKCNDTPAREPPETLKTRKQLFCKVCTPLLEPSFERNIVFENHEKHQEYTGAIVVLTIGCKGVE